MHVIFSKVGTGAANLELGGEGASNVRNIQVATVTPIWPAQYHGFKAQNNRVASIPHIHISLHSGRPAVYTDITPHEHPEISTGNQR